MGEAREMEVAAGLVFREGRLLIAQRREEDHQGGLWEFPGGKVEVGEDHAACLRREILEELGMEVVVEAEVESLTHAYADRVVHLRFFRCTWFRHEPRPIACQAFAWVLPTELAGYRFPAADRRLLERLRDDVALWDERRS